MPGYEMIGTEEASAVQEIFATGGGVLFRHGFDHIRGNSYQVQDFESEFAKFIGSPHALAVSSGTAALRVALASLDVGQGDEVITQSFTFVATAEAIIESGAKPIFAEIDDTLNMSPESLKKRISSKTKAVIVVHMLGTPARLDEILEICGETGIPLIEDTAWGCGGEFRNLKLGTHGDIGCFSFDFAKTMTTGEGGMVVYKDEKQFLKGKAYHDHGHENNPTLPRWEDSRISSGFNYRMTELQGAIGRIQLRKLNSIVEAQRKNSESIISLIKRYKYFKIRQEPQFSNGTCDAVVFSCDSLSATRIRSILQSNGISTKILPEATTWHFARHWSHLLSPEELTEASLENSFGISSEILSKFISLPNGVFLRENFLLDLEKSLEQVVSEIESND